METDEHGVLTEEELAEGVRRWGEGETEGYLALRGGHWEQILKLIARAQHDHDVAELGPRVEHLEALVERQEAKIERFSP